MQGQRGAIMCARHTGILLSFAATGMAMTEKADGGAVAALHSPELDLVVERKAP